jgi:cytidine deaminase
MPDVPNMMLIERAATVVRPRKIGAYLVGDVGAALLSDGGNVYTGVCLDISSGIGFCAEHSAIAAMVTAGEYRIQKIVAVWKDESGQVCIVAPCGRCREFMRQIHAENLATEVIMERDRVVRLAELLPYHDWYHPLSEA